MRFVWDPAKSDANLRDRGFDFVFASLIFEGLTVEVEDRRRDYGERRIVAIGIADGCHFTLVYTSMNKPSTEARRPSRGHADLSRLRRMSDAQVARTSPAEVADLPDDF